MTTERIGIFGGTFDPPHLGHICVARSAVIQFGLSRVLWIPAFQSPHKTDRVGASVSQRCEMTELCIAEDRRFELSKIEVERGGISFSVDTLEHLSRTFTDAELFLILGADSFSSFGSWRQPDRIVGLASLIVYPRGVTRPDDSGTGYNARWLQMDKIEISSSDIRSRIAEGREFRQFVSDSVRAYIIENRLYQNS